MKKYKISEHKDEIITHIIKNAIWLPIAAIIPVFVTLIKKLQQSLLTYNKENLFVIILCIVSILLSSITIIFFVYGRLKKTKKDSDFRVENSLPVTLFRVKSVETELFFQNRKDIISTVSYDLEANENDIKYFEKEIIWTGKDYYGTEMIECNGNYSFEIIDSNDSLHKFKVLFNDPVKCQDRIKFKIETKVSDSNFMMNPVSSYMVKHQIDLLTIRVVVPKNLIKNVKQTIYADLARQIKIGDSLNVQKKNIGLNDCYEIIIQNPTLLYRYYLEWEFTN